MNAKEENIKAARELIDRLYNEVAEAVKANKFKSLFFDPEFSEFSKIGQIREVALGMMRSDRKELNTIGKKLLDHAYSEAANMIKARGISTPFFDPTFSQRSKSIQVSYLLRVLFED